MDPSLKPARSLRPLPLRFTQPLSHVPHQHRTRPPPTVSAASSATSAMSHRLGRVFSDISRGNHRKATDDHGLHHQSTSNNESSSNVAGNKAKLRLSILFPGVRAWRRSDGTDGGDTGGGKNKKQQQTEETGGKRRGLDIGQVASKYLSMVEQLFSSSSGGRRKKTDRSSELRRRSHTFTSSRGGGSGNTPSSSKRHKGRLSSAPASLRGSPANSGHLSVAESVKTPTSSELNTMEELQSAVQAAIAHCKNSLTKQAAAGDGRCKC